MEFGEDRPHDLLMQRRHQVFQLLVKPPGACMNTEGCRRLAGQLTIHVLSGLLNKSPAVRHNVRYDN